MRALGLDIGTTQIKAALLNAGDNVIAEYALPTPYANPRATHSLAAGDPVIAGDLDMEKVVAYCRSLADDFSKRFGSIDVIGVTGQMHGLGFLDKHGQIVGNYFSWRNDIGAHIERDEIIRLLEVDDRLASTDLLPDGPGIGVRILAGIARHGAIPSSAQYISFVPEIVTHAINGFSNHVSRTSLAASGFLCEADGQLQGLAVATHPLNNFDGVFDSNPFEGVSSAASLTSIAVFATSGDFQAAAYGADLRPDELLINMGTGGQVAKIVEDIDPLTRHEYRPYFGGCLLCCQAGLSSGGAYSGVDPSDFDDIDDLVAQQFSECIGDWLATTHINQIVIQGGLTSFRPRIRQAIEHEFSGTTKIRGASLSAAAGIAKLALVNMRSNSSGAWSALGPLTA